MVRVRNPGPSAYKTHLVPSMLTCWCVLGMGPSPRHCASLTESGVNREKLGELVVSDPELGGLSKQRKT